MAYRYKKSYRIKRKKSVLKNRFFWFGILLLAVIGGISYFLFLSGIFQVKKVMVDGGVKWEENIRPLVPPKNIFFINTSKTEKDISGKFPQIAEIKVRRSFPDALKISVIERTAQALWCEEEKCFLMDGGGGMFGESQSETSLIKITGAKELLGKEKISEILEIQVKLKNVLVATTTGAVIVSEERLNVKTSEGWEIYFNTADDLDWQVQELALVLEKQITPEKRRNLEYIDLRFSRVYYK